MGISAKAAEREVKEDEKDQFEIFISRMLK